MAIGLKMDERLIFSFYLVIFEIKASISISRLSINSNFLSLDIVAIVVEFKPSFISYLEILIAALKEGKSLPTTKDILEKS